MTPGASRLSARAATQTVTSSARRTTHTAVCAGTAHSTVEPNAQRRGNHASRYNDDGSTVATIAAGTRVAAVATVAAGRTVTDDARRIEGATVAATSARTAAAARSTGTAASARGMDLDATKHVRDAEQEIEAA